MAMSLSAEVRMIKGVGPQRAELLARRGICTLEDLLGYLPFRYEDRIHFSHVKEIQPNGTYTIRAAAMPFITCWCRMTPAACCLANFFMAVISRDG
jgi:RecG-like helicase